MKKNNIILIGINLWNKKGKKYRTGLVIFSTLILIISVVMCMLIFNWMEVETVSEIISKGLKNEIASNVMLAISIIFILLAIKCIFFSSSNKEKKEYKNGILLENSDGKLLITRDTLENLVNTIVKSFDGAENAVAQVELDNENNLKVFVNISVKENAVIKELSSNIQARIKEAIKNTSDLDVKEVNIKVKDVAPVKKSVVQE